MVKWVGGWVGPLFNGWLCRRAHSKLTLLSLLSDFLLSRADKHPTPT
jgi:hypothetical protein